jgi:ABC-2 type transport system ATP-binding protein
VYDGKLAELTRNHANYKVLSIVFEAPIDQQAIEKFGEIELFDGSSVNIRVQTKDVQTAASRILADFPVEDINIQEPNIEDIIREIFQRNSKL